MKITILKGDITTIAADAIVNAANSSLLGGGGVDGAIHRKGGPAITDECMQIRSKQGGCKTGEAVITSGGNLPAKYVIHTVGPVWQGGKNEEPALLKDCYVNSLRLADSKQLTNIAFPNISTGIYGFPKELAAPKAAEAIHSFAKQYPGTSIREVMFICFDTENYQLYLSQFTGTDII